MNKVKAAIAKLKEINSNIVIDVAHSTILEKVTDKDEYWAGLQAYTISKPVPTSNDIDQFEMVNVKELPLKSNQKHLDLMFFLTGGFGE